MHRTILVHLATVALYWGVLAGAASAGPANPTPFTLVQPDGASFIARAVGDEWSNGQETMDGYAILKDAGDGYWKYADRGPTGALVVSPYVVTKDSPEGRVPRGLRAPRPAGAPPAFASALSPAGAVALGSRPTLVILAQFTNKAAMTTPAAWQASFFGATNSVKHHYAVSSYNQMTIVPATESSGTANDGVVGWVSLASAHPDTRNNTGTANQQLTKDAIVAADPFVNFAAYDTNGNGRIAPNELMIVVIAAGNETSFGGVSGSCSPSVWGHMWSIFSVAPPSVDGVSVGGDGYGQFGEMHCSISSPPGQQATIGIMAHEMGHLLGLPDLYDTDQSSQGVGKWSLMAGGSWNRVVRDGDSPSLLDPWSKAFLGWTTPTLVSGTITTQTFPASATNNVIYQFRAGSAITGTGEYFLVENRQQTSYDVALPAGGLLIWHIDEALTTNQRECIPFGVPACNSTNHYKVALIQADNQFSLERNINAGDAGDPFPGTLNNRTFTDASAPRATLWGGAASDITVTNISNSGPLMTATLSVSGVPPVMSVTPSVQDFGTVALFQTADRPFTVSNGGGGTLTGTATTSAPFSVVSGGSYSLTPGASQVVTVRYSPTTAGIFFSNVTFTMTGGPTQARGVTGATPAPTLLSVTPSVGVRGTSPTVTLTGNNFATGMTVGAIAGITPSNVVVTSSTTATAMFAIAPTATVGARSVVVATSLGISNAVTFTVVDPYPDLSLATTHVGNFGVGFNERYTVAVTNVGTLASTGTLTVTNTLPTGMTFVSGVGGGWSCGAVGPNVTCTNASSLGVSASASFVLTVTVGPAAVGTVTHTSTVSGTGDLNSANNTGMDPTIVRATPTPSFQFNPTSPSPGQQSTVAVTIGTTFPHDVTGSVTLAFGSNATVPANDPAVQFATGGRTITFTIPAESTQARFGSATATGPVGFQPGTVAGALTFTGTFTAGTVNGNFNALHTVTRQAPKIHEVRVNQDGGFSVRVLLSSTPRDLASVSLTFNTAAAVKLSCGTVTGCTTSGNTLTFDVSGLFAGWFQGDVTFGSLSTLTIPLTVPSGIGGNVTVTLRNSQGTSNAGVFALP